MNALQNALGDIGKETKENMSKDLPDMPDTKALSDMTKEGKLEEKAKAHAASR
jgi:hypothetical protein